MNVYLHLHLKMHAAFGFGLVIFAVIRYETVQVTRMSIARFDSSITISCAHLSRAHNGEWANKAPFASKTAVMRQLRQWWVAH
jgi:hypothetical protein